MAEFTERHEKALDETHDAVIQIRTVLLGVNGDEGLVGIVQQVVKEQSKLKKTVWTLIGILVGSGVISGSIFAALSG